MTQIPKKLNKCPLVDVIFEIRFNPIVPPEVVFPMIYSRISNDFGPIESLPVSQIPAQTLHHYSGYGATRTKTTSFRLGPRL